MGRCARAKRLKRGRRLRGSAAVVLASVGLLFACLVAAVLLTGVMGGSSPAPRAAIVDQVSVYDANPEFVAAATEILEEAGYAVDYYPGEQVTVDLYRELPTHDYDLLVLRVHSARLLKDKEGRPVDEVVLFTSEPFSASRYRDEQEAALAKVGYHRGGDLYFGIRADFVASSMRGGFGGTTMIMMGCSGLTSINETARAFVLKGAESFISWDNPLSWSHSDRATERLIQLMVIEGLPTADAVAQTNAELGPDPAFGAELRVLTP